MELLIDNQQDSIDFGGTVSNTLGPIRLQQDEKWENTISFAPRQTGNDQEVELLLFKNSETTPVDSLRIFINVEQTE